MVQFGVCFHDFSESRSQASTNWRQGRQDRRTGATADPKKRRQLEEDELAAGAAGHAGPPDMLVAPRPHLRGQDSVQQSEEKRS
jgi:hypothetical protein